MTWDDFDGWSPLSLQGAAAQLVTSGLLGEPEATARVTEQLAGLLYDGIATPTHRLWTVRSTGPDPCLVGYLWMRVRPSAHEVEAFVFDIEIVPAVRGRGWGRATMLAAERAARDAGASVVRLNVFARNPAGVRLYEGLGYDVVGSTLIRRLDEPSPPTPAGGRWVDLRPMTDEQYAGFRDAHAASGTGPDDRSEHRAATDELDRMLPHGPATPGHRLWAACDGGVLFAGVWVRLAQRSDGCHAFLQTLRPAGSHLDLLSSVVRAVERACVGVDVRSLSMGLPESLPACTTAHRVLVELCGYRVAAATMAKPL